MGSNNDVPNGLKSALGGLIKDFEPQKRGFLNIFKSVFVAKEAAGPTSAQRENKENASKVLTAPTHGMANLRRLRVDDVAIPKVDIVAVSLDIAKDELVEVFRREGFSRMPVFKGTLDQPQGLILLKGFGAPAWVWGGGAF